MARYIDVRLIPWLLNNLGSFLYAALVNSITETYLISCCSGKRPTPGFVPDPSDLISLTYRLPDGKNKVMKR